MFSSKVITRIEELREGSLTTTQIAAIVRIINNKAISTQESSINISPLLTILSLPEVIAHRTISSDVFAIINQLFSAQKLKLTSEVITYLIRILTNQHSTPPLIEKTLECIRLFTVNRLLFSSNHIGALLDYEKNQPNERVTSSILSTLSNLSLGHECSASIAVAAQEKAVSTRLLVKAIEMKSTSTELLASLSVLAVDKVIMQVYTLRSLLRANPHNIDEPIQKLHSDIDALSSDDSLNLPLSFFDHLFPDFTPAQEKRSGLLLSTLDKLIQKNLINLDALSTNYRRLMTNHITNQAITLSTVSVFNIFSYIRKTHSTFLEKDSIFVYVPIILRLMNDSTPENFRQDLYSSIVLILNSMFHSQSAFIRGITALESLDTWPVREEVLSERNSLSEKLNGQLAISTVLARNPIPAAQDLINMLTQPHQDNKLFPASPDTDKKKKRVRIEENEGIDSDDENQRSPKKQRTPPPKSTSIFIIPSNPRLEEIDAPSSSQESTRSSRKKTPPKNSKLQLQTRQSLPNANSTLYSPTSNRRTSSSSADSKNKPAWR